MKKVLAIACLLVVLTMVVAIVASAAPATTQANWRLYFKATDTGGGSSLGDCSVGVLAGMKDGYGVDGPASDANDVRAALSTASFRAVVGVFDSKAWNRDIKSNRLPKDPAYNTGVALDPVPDPLPDPDTTRRFGTYPYEPNRKVWDLRVAGLGSANTLATVLTIRFVSVAAGLPPVTNLPVYGTDPPKTAAAAYWLRMVDNRGIPGAPENGTVWSIPVPSVWNGGVAFFSLTLPTFNISVAKDEYSLIEQGYKMQFYQTPEPSSLLALGAGLMGLAGFVSRKRRS